MIAPELELNLRQMFAEAQAHRHEFVSIEHLLLAVLNNPAAGEVLTACGVELPVLLEQVTEFIYSHTPVVPEHVKLDRDIQPTFGFQRVMQRAILYAQSANMPEVDGPQVLVALFPRRGVHRFSGQGAP